MRIIKAQYNDRNNDDDYAYDDTDYLPKSLQSRDLRRLNNILLNYKYYIDQALEILHKLMETDPYISYQDALQVQNSLGIKLEYYVEQLDLNDAI